MAEFVVRVIFEGDGGARGPFGVFFCNTLFGGATDVDCLSFAYLSD